MSTSGMHRRPFEGRHLVINGVIVKDEENANYYSARRYCLICLLNFHDF